MLKFRESVIALLFLIFLSFAQNNQNVENSDNEFSTYKEFKDRYEFAVDMFKKGSYYSAIDEIYPVLLYPENPFYPYGLFLMSKIYLHIGKKIGKKDFLIKALYFINTYLYTSKDAQKNWDYYYTKGNIYENIFQYEKAISYYKISYLYAKDKEEQFKSIIALLRTSAWIKKLDIATRYLILINIEELSKEQKNEFYFVKGLLAFKQGKYKEAFGFLSKVYKDYEQFLIDNPYYYLIVAETAYRYGKLKFSQQLFRRILSVVKDPFIVRQSLLRLGDIELSLNHPVYAFNNYYSIIEKYPESQEAKIAKLKILSAQDFYKEIKKKVLLLQKKDKDFKEPFIYAYKEWISNRNNYLGDFAIANFGYETFKLQYEKLFRKFLWELSLVSPGSFKYEHIEYINKLWTPHLTKENADNVCRIYISNPDLFKKIFIKNKPVMKAVLKDLWLCGKTKEELDLALFLNKKWNSKISKIYLAKAYLDNKQYQKAIQILRKIKDNSCFYYKVIVQSILLSGNKPDIDLKVMERVCKNDLTAKVYEALAYYTLGKIEISIKKLVSLGKDLSIIYDKDPFIRKTVRDILDKLITENKYKDAYTLITPLLRSKKDTCYIYSTALIVSVRLSREKDADSFYKKIEKCSSEAANIAKSIYKNYKLFKEVR